MPATVLNVCAITMALTAGQALAQLDRVTTDLLPQYPGVSSLRTAYGIGACRDGGAAIVGGEAWSNGVNLIRVKPSGEVSWERHYSVLPYTYGGVGVSVEETADLGFAIAAYPQITFDDNPYKLGILKVKSSGELEWGLMTQATMPNGPVGYKQWDAPRVRQLPDGSIVAIGVNDADLPSICSPPPQLDRFDTGVLFKARSSGRPVFSRLYGEAGFGRRSHVAFTDMAIGENGIFVIGAIRGASECEGCTQDIDGLVAWLDFDGNPIAAWGIDSPVDPPPIKGCERRPSDEWGSSIAVKGRLVYFSLADSMSYSASGDAFVGCLDIGTGNLVWSGRIKDLWPMYHCLELSVPSGNVLVGGHRPTDQGSRAGLAILKPTNGSPISGRIYEDPRQPFASALPTFRGVAAGREDSAWLVNGAMFGGPGEVYYMQVDAAGDSACSSSEREVSLGEYLKVNRRNLQVVGELEIKEWKPDAQKVNTQAIDPCR